MKIKRLLWFAFAIVVVVLPLAAQDSGQAPADQIPEGQAPADQNPADQAVFAPFVSRLQGEIKNNLIRLSWVDSPDVRGPVYVYRSTRPFEGTDSFQGLKPVEIPYGVQYYVDEIENGGTLYYFVAASDETGRSYDVPIVANNYISIQIPADSYSSAAVTPAATGQTEKADSSQNGAGTPAGISSLKADSQGASVIITFTVSPDFSGAKSAVLYRSVQPIKEAADLLGAVIIRTEVTSPFTDYPVPGIPYYYAVIAGEDLIRGTAVIIPGSNATLTPAQVSAGGASPGGDIRAIPLPEITVQTAIPDTSAYTGTPPSAGLSPQAAKALENTQARPQAAPEFKKPRVFARDLEVPSTRGEDYTLALIVKGSFAAKNWEAARNELVRFLALPRSPEATARARFYLGQSYYFQYRLREGLFEFLAIQDRYPAEAAEWIQASLALMKE